MVVPRRSPFLAVAPKPQTLDLGCRFDKVPQPLDHHVAAANNNCKGGWKQSAKGTVTSADFSFNSNTAYSEIVITAAKASDPPFRWCRRPETALAGSAPSHHGEFGCCFSMSRPARPLLS
jgi:hypothetical protein